MQATRSTTLATVRRLVRGVGVVKRAWRLNLAELRQQARRLPAVLLAGGKW